MQTINTLLDAGIAAVRAGQNQTARTQLLQVLKLDPRHEVAWLWLSQAMPTLDQSLRCVEHLLTINPHNKQAREARDSLQIRLMLAEAGIVHQPTEPAVLRRRYLLGESLVEARFITQQQLRLALQYQAQQALLRQPMPLGAILIRLGFIKRDQLEAALAAQVETAVTQAPSLGVGRLGEYLARTGALTVAQLEQALEQQSRMHRQGNSYLLGEVIVSLGYMSRHALNDVLLNWKHEFEDAVH